MRTITLQFLRVLPFARGPMLAVVFGLFCSLCASATPKITGISPDSGPPGTELTLTGSGFLKTLEVVFGKTPSSFTPLSDKQLLVAVPNGAITGPLVVYDASGWAQIEFTVTAAATIHDISLNPAPRGALVTVAGRNWGKVLAVYLGNTRALFDLISPNELVFEVPFDAVEGPLQLNFDKGFVSAAFDVMAAPQLTAAKPSSGEPGILVGLSGSSLVGVTTVRVGKISAAFHVDSSTQISLFIPANALSGPISVESIAGTASIDFQVLVSPPAPPLIASVSPKSGAPGTEVIVLGSGFASVNGAAFGKVAAAFKVISDTQVNLTVPVGAESGPFFLYTPNASASDVFEVTVPPALPLIASVSPKSGAPGTEVIVLGSGFASVNGTAFGKTAAAFKVISDTQVNLTVPVGAESGPFFLYTPNASASDVFEVLEIINPGAGPAITGFSPAAGAPGTLVRIDGTGLKEAIGVHFGAIPAAFSFSGTMLSATVPELALSGPITVVTPSAKVLSSAPFTVHSPVGRPQIATMEPAVGTPGDVVQIAGTGFAGLEAAFIGSVPAPFVVADDQRVVLTVPTGAKSGPIRFRSGGGDSSSPDSFTVLNPPEPPVLTHLKPEAGAPGSKVRLEGARLAGATAVRFQGVAASFQVESASTIVAVVPDNAETSLVAVETPDGRAVAEATFQVLRPPAILAVHGFEPRFGKPGTRVRLQGSGLADISGIKLAGQLIPVSVPGETEVEIAIPPGARSGSFVALRGAESAASRESFQIDDGTLAQTPPPKLAPAVAVPGAASFAFVPEPNRTYTVEHTADLGASAWREIERVGARENPTQTSIDLPTIGISAGFVRLGAIVPTVENWDFEFGLVNWVATGDAFSNQPTEGVCVLMDELERTAPNLSRTVGGDYWNVPVHLGHHDHAWIGTAQNHPDVDAPLITDQTPYERLTGTLTSKEFRLRQPFVTFLLGGRPTRSPDPAQQPRVELHAKPRSKAEDEAWGRPGPKSFVPVGGGFYRLRVTRLDPALDTERLRRVVMDATDLGGCLARLVLIDAAIDGHLNVDDIRFTDQNPLTTRGQTVALAGGAIHRDAPAPVWGLVDTHTHPAANMAFGRRLISGLPDGPFARALRRCEPEHGINGSNICPGGDCGGNILLPFGLDGHHATSGYEHAWDGWPSFKSITHQQMHVEFIRRAWQGGLRLMVTHVVNNEMLGAQNGGNVDGIDSDASNINRQIGALKDLVARHPDFMEIAYTAVDARRIIHEGRLAVVLGVEVDNAMTGTGNGRRHPLPDDVLTADQITRHIAGLHRLGIRHYFPVHFTDNPFGGCALYNDMWTLNNYNAHGTWFAIQPRPGAEYSALLEEVTTSVAFTIGTRTTDLAPLRAWFSSLPPGGHGNARPLHPGNGPAILHQLMRHGIIIDSDHMALNTKIGALNYLQGHDYPVVAGHTSFSELGLRRGTETTKEDKLANEADLMPELMNRYRDHGYLVSPIAITKDNKSWGAQVPNDAAGSSKSWAQRFLYAADKLGRRNVGFATDYGLVHGSAPRFGLNAGYGLEGDHPREAAWRAQVDAQSNGVRYAEPITDYRSHRFEGPAEREGVYSSIEREAWEAIALFRAGVDPERCDPPPRTARIHWFARGLRAASASEIIGCCGHSPYEMRAAFYVARNQTPTAADDPVVRDTYFPQLKRVWDRWNLMSGSNRPMHRFKMAGILGADPNRPFVRDFDINLDGMAHYGLIPDWLQDLRNVGLTRDDLRLLFDSAEAYLRMWERCEAVSRRLGGPDPASN